MLKYSLAAIVNICVVLGITALLQISAGISFEVAYFSTLLVIISSYYALQKRLARELESTQQQAAEQDKQEAASKGVGVSKFMLGVQLSFGLYRLLSYIVLGLCVVVLIDLGYFHIVGYVAGVLVCLCSVVILARI